MNEKTRIQIEEMKKQTIGVEVEMNNIDRSRAAKVAAEFFGTGRYENTAHRNGYSTWSAWYTFLATIDLQKTIKLRDTNYFTPPPLLSLLFLSSLSSNQRFCNVYSQAAHFRSGFSGGEIHDLRRLRREGFPERLSRS